MSDPQSKIRLISHPMLNILENYSNISKGLDTSMWHDVGKTKPRPERLFLLWEEGELRFAEIRDKRCHIGGISCFWRAVEYKKWVYFDELNDAYTNDKKIKSDKSTMKGIK